MVAIISAVSDTALPTVAITSPLDGGLVTKNSIITISATALDNVGVTKVEFYINAKLSHVQIRQARIPVPGRFPVLPGVPISCKPKPMYDTQGNVGSSSIVRAKRSLINRKTLKEEENIASDRVELNQVSRKGYDNG